MLALVSIDSVAVPSGDAGNPSCRMPDAHQSLAPPHTAAIFLHQLSDPRPHFSRSVRWIAKAVDQSLDDRSIAGAAGQECAHERGERKSFDPLRGPLRADFGTIHAPNFLRVAAEEDFVDPASKRTHDPIFEA